MTIRGIDLFCGAGGLTMGLKSAGIQTIAAVDKNPDAIASYKLHTPESEHLCGNILELDLKKYRGAVDVVYGGPPCQPFSTGGLRRGSGDSRNMIPAFISAVDTIKPRAFLMENVPGLAVQSRISYLYEILDSFFGMGYCVSWHVLNAADYGVPQKRRRLFLIGFKSRPFWFPRPTHGPEGAIPHISCGRFVSSEPIGDPPTCPVVFAKYPDLRPSPYAGHLYNGGGRPIDLASPCHTILASAGGYKTHWVDTSGVAVSYHKHLMKGGSPLKGEVPGARRLTVEESTIIQTFPKDMKFVGSRSSRYTQVGDAVPPLLAAVLGVELVQQLEGATPDVSTHFDINEYQQLLSLH